MAQGGPRTSGMWDHAALWSKGVNRLAARGPEGHKWHDVSGATMCFTRLAINGLNDVGMQPFASREDGLVWMCNGEIYNSKELEKATDTVSKSGSDCEVLGPVWRLVDQDPVKFARSLDGVFAIVMAIDGADGTQYIIARDPYGVRPLFYCNTIDDSWFFASERKAIEPFASGEAIYEFPPGHVWVIDGTAITKHRYYETPWLRQTASVGYGPIRSALISAVDKRLMTERPVAALLSGGLDSSLIAALVQMRLKEAGKPPLKTFSIGMEGSTDLAFARLVANHIESDHHEIVVTADEMFDAIPEVIKAIESYDITTVRASVGNWLVARAVKEQSDCKVVFNGDGSDEVFGSYLYFFRAPSDLAYEDEVRRLLEEISQYDVLRSDRTISCHGLEARTPFLDRQFVSAALQTATVDRRPDQASGRMEKQMLRDAFDGMGLLPHSVLYRRKEAFSDGVSCKEKSWYEIIQDKIEERGLVPAGWTETAYKKNYWPSPPTAEAFYYRELFERDYPQTGGLWPYWMPRWSPETTDPSARTLSSL